MAMTMGSAIDYVADLHNPLPREVAERVLGAVWSLHDRQELGAIIFHIHEPGRPAIKVVLERQDG